MASARHDAVFAALQVLRLTPHIRQYLVDHDQRALAQADDAFAFATDTTSQAISLAMARDKAIKEGVYGYAEQYNGRNIPAAACPRCGGWTSHGGMSQYADSTMPVDGRIGCRC